jgi:hypothetical protein
MRTLKDLDTAAIVLCEVWLKIRSVAEIPDGDIRAALDEMDLAAIHAAADVIGDIAREPDEDFQRELLDRYATVRRFLPKLLKHLDFDAGADQTPGRGVRRGHEVLQALDFLKAIERRRTDIDPSEVPAGVLPSAWHRRVFPKRGEHAGTFNRHAHTVAAVECARPRPPSNPPRVQRAGCSRAGRALGEHPAYLLMRYPGARADLAQAPPLTPRVRHRHHQRRAGHLLQHRAHLRQPAQPYRRCQVGDLPTKTIDVSTQERHTFRLRHQASLPWSGP